MVNVFIVDDHAVFREGLKAVLQKDPDIHVIGEADDGSVAPVGVEKLRPDIVLMDIHMPYDGLRATVDILHRIPGMKILMLTISENEDDLHEAVKAGARGYILKDAGIDVLISSIKAAAAGAAIFTPVMADRLLDEFHTPLKKRKDNLELTERELEVLKLVANGATNKEIAVALSISEPTVKTHLSNILGKLHLKNRSQAAVYASQNNWFKENAEKLSLL